MHLFSLARQWFELEKRRLGVQTQESQEEEAERVVPGMAVVHL